MSKERMGSGCPVLISISTAISLGVLIALLAVDNLPRLRHGILESATVRADETSCSVASLGGTYVIQGQGTIVAEAPGLPPPPFAFAETGIVTFDRAEKLSGKTTVSFNGVVIQPTFAGTYTVNSDCTANFTIQSSIGLTIHDDVVVIDGGRRFESIEPDPFVVITRRAERLAD